MTATIITEALQAAIDMIATERQEFADCAERHDGTFTAADATILREYGDMLAKLRAAQSATAAMTDEIERMRAALDALGVAIADAGYTWTPEMRSAYEKGAK